MIESPHIRGTQVNMHPHMEYIRTVVLPCLDTNYTLSYELHASKFSDTKSRRGYILIFLISIIASHNSLKNHEVVIFNRMTHSVELSIIK